MPQCWMREVFAEALYIHTKDTETDTEKQLKDHAIHLPFLLN